jgi:hypothetical protein
MAFGSSPDISSWSRKPSNPSTTRSGQDCLPMSPGWTTIELAEGVPAFYIISDLISIR